MCYAHKRSWIKIGNGVYFNERSGIWLVIFTSFLHFLPHIHTTEPVSWKIIKQCSIPLPSPAFFKYYTNKGVMKNKKYGICSTKIYAKRNGRKTNTGQQLCCRPFWIVSPVGDDPLQCYFFVILPTYDACFRLWLSKPPESTWFLYRWSLSNYGLIELYALYSLCSTYILVTSIMKIWFQGRAV